MRRMQLASQAALATVLLPILLASNLMASGIKITPSRASYHPGEQINVTINCACPFPCGNPTGMDDVFLRRQPGQPAPSTSRPVSHPPVIMSSPSGPATVHLLPSGRHAPERQICKPRAGLLLTST
jgi:hypothetical protein